MPFIIHRNRKMSLRMWSCYSSFFVHFMKWEILRSQLKFKRFPSSEPYLHLYLLCFIIIIYYLLPNVYLLVELTLICVMNGEGIQRFSLGPVTMQCTHLPMSRTNTKSNNRNQNKKRQPLSLNRENLIDVLCV